ncbi:response regulator [Pararhodobacter zhoushanensis]|uniref:Response regulator n=1 Tax=Pararhodobacter zhoushanensis TaxID=2479545 RepID=A0ABT3GVD1_9RHOB|nr:response regulator [Pararhodobacter zhoushanensis]MCW1931492.1 response regulator [Pararhodobacter zhoushanensis]
MSVVIKLALLVDDEEIDQRQYKRVLTRSGLIGEIISFTYADDALAFLKENPDLEVDVIFLDINMPRMNGFEFIEAAVSGIGERFVKGIVVMLTTSLNPADRERAATYGIVKDFITKPLTIEHVQRVARLIADGN